MQHKYKTALLGPLPPTIGGVTTHMKNLLRSPVASQFDLIPVQTMSRKHGTALYAKEPLFSKIRQIIYDWVYLLKILFRHKPSLIHINSSFNSGAFWRDALYLLTSVMCGAKVVLQYHGGKLDEFMKLYPKWFKFFILFIINRASFIVVLSGMQAQPLKTCKCRDKIRILPNMIDVSRYAQKTHFSSMNKPLRLMMIASHLTVEKGVYEILKAVQILAAKQYALSLKIIGEGKEREKMETFIRENGLAGIIDITGFLSKEKISTHLAGSDCFVLPSYSEGFPMVLLEAMASGLPVIATRVGAVAEMIDEDKGGYLINPYDVNALTETIEKMIRNRHLCGEMGKYNFQKCKKLYSIERVSNQFITLYNEAL